MKYFNILLRSLIGLIFITSSLLKIPSLEVFELFVYEHFNCTFSLASIFSRLLIGLEFVIGILYLSNWGKKIRFSTSLILIMAFSYFLFQHLDLENCLCFGESLPFTAKEGLIKNVILLLLCVLSFFLHQKTKNELPKYALGKKTIIAISSLVMTIILFVVYPPDSLLKLLYSSNSSTLAYYEITNEGKIKDIDSVFGFYNLDNDVDMFYPFFSAGCKHCKTANQKLMIMNEKLNIEEQTKLLIFGDSLKVDTFLYDTSQEIFDYEIVFVDHFFLMTDGEIPSFFFRKSGKYYRLKVHELDDQIIKSFLEE